MTQKDFTSLVPVTCPLTGIAFRVELETPINNLFCVHPFSLAESVEEIVKQAATKGLKLPNLYSTNVLAGMLIAVLQHFNLCVCKDPLKANGYLQNAGAESLTAALTFICNRSSFRGFPKLALLDFTLNHYWGFGKNVDGTSKNEAADLLKNYVRACSGHVINDPRIQTQQEEKFKNAADKVRVYTDKVKQETFNLRASKDRGFDLLENLTKAFGHKYPKVITDLQNTLKSLATVKKERRQSLADMIEMVFEDSKDAAELAEILRKANTDSLQKDLETVTEIGSIAGIQKDAVSGRIKVDFVSKIMKAIDKE